MSRPSPKISTTVRNVVGLYALRLRFLVGTWLAPAATVERAARLFCTPDPSGHARPAPAAEGARQTWLDFDGQRLATYQWGDPSREPYVLFSHGWASHGARIGPWVAPLRAAGYAVVAFDQTAHGRSAGELATLPGFTRALLAVGERYGPAAAVIGHSFGGAAAMLALAQGLQAACAILIAPAADPVAAAQRFARFIWMGEHLCQRMFALFQARLGVTLEALQAHRNAPRIGRPALVVHDAGDDVVPWEEGERYARYWPGSRLLTTQGLGHRRIAVDPAVIAAGLRFLRGEAVGERVVSSPNLPLGVA